MKKITLIAAAVLASTTMASAQGTIGNPKDPNAEGKYIVAYDIKNNKWCDANPEIDETFVFAIDFTGTGFEDAMKALPEPNRLNIQGRSGAFDIFNNMNLNEADETAVAKADGRLFPIDREKNIYGMTVNLFQLITSRTNDAAFGPNADYSDYAVLKQGQDFAFGDNVFAFGWSTDNPGAEWWDGIATPVQDVLKWDMAPYTGTKTGREFTYGELHADDTECPLTGLDNGAFLSMVKDWGGYGTPADFDAATAGINNVSIDSTADIVATEYYDLMGRRVNGEIENGVTIRRVVLSNGQAVVSKIAR